VRAGRNATRRNRNIGTAAQGRGDSGELRIPGQRDFWEQLRDPVWVERVVDDYHVAIAVEPPLKGWMHAVTPDDIAAYLRLLPTIM